MTATEIRSRIFNVVPPGSWQMEELLGLLEVTVDDTIPSACVDCSARPRLRINPQFIRDHCHTDEHLVMLVFHELYHVTLGHTRLFERPTPAHNIAFDAIINAMLCHQFPQREYLSFFWYLNSPKEFPSCLLRPPLGWRKSICFPPKITPETQRLLHLLYGYDGVKATYREIFDALVSELKGADGKGCILLGNHEREESGRREGTKEIADSAVARSLREIVSRWLGPDRPLITNQGITPGCGQGFQSKMWHLQPDGNPPDPLKEALAKLLRRAGVYRGARQAAQQRVASEKLLPVETVVPQARDRRAPTWRKLVPNPPLIFQGLQLEKRIVQRPHPVAHVYLDISGSMAHLLPRISGALRKPYRQGLLRLFVFSTVVDEVAPRDLTRQVRNGFGTDINCVLEHLCGIPHNKRPRRVVLITDGLVGRPNPSLLDPLAKIRFHAGLPEGYIPRQLQPLEAHITQLPDCR